MDISGKSDVYPGGPTAPTVFNCKERAVLLERHPKQFALEQTAGNNGRSALALNAGSRHDGLQCF